MSICNIDRDLEEVCHCSSKTIAKSKISPIWPGIRKPYDRKKKVRGGIGSKYKELERQAKNFYLESQFSCFYSKAVILANGQIERIPMLKLFAPKEDVWREYKAKHNFGVGRTTFLTKCKPVELRVCKFEKCEFE